MGRTFDSNAIEKCLDRLDEAREALFRARSTGQVRDLRRHYSLFLRACGGVINMIEAAAQATPQGKQWYGGKRNAAKKDDLLRYMHQARNVEEHSAANPAIFKPSRVTLGSAPAEYGPPDAGLGIPGGGSILNIWNGERRLLPLVDTRYNQHFAPPAEHAGKPLRSQDPIEVGEVYLAYLEAIVREVTELN